jgi:hypothetical protein
MSTTARSKTASIEFHTIPSSPSRIRLVKNNLLPSRTDTSSGLAGEHPLRLAVTPSNRERSDVGESDEHGGWGAFLILLVSMKLIDCLAV